MLTGRGMDKARMLASEAMLELELEESARLVTLDREAYRRKVEAAKERIRKRRAFWRNLRRLFHV